MSLRMPLVQIILLIVGLLVCSALPITGLAVVLADVRLLLLMVLGVAALYLGLMLRRGEQALMPVVVDDSWLDDRVHEAERGA
jgi:hypothetical protein